MCDAPVLVIGGGPAGVAAAVSLAESDHRVVLVEQRDRLGGAIHRQPANRDIVHSLHGRHHTRNWRALNERLSAVQGKIRILYNSVFLGADDTGHALIEDRALGRTLSAKAAGLLVAVGAIEHIEPFEGWQLPGVMTAGGAQLMLKETGRFVPGRTLVVGSGPLIFAVATQLASAGAPPVALVERGTPWRAPGAAFRLLASRSTFAETMRYGSIILRKRIPYKTGTGIVRAEASGSVLLVEVTSDTGRIARYEVDNLVISNGLRSNQIGLPRTSESSVYPILHAGDCREILGADAAIEDGAFAARKLVALLKGAPTPSPSHELEKARKLQAALRKLTSLDHSELVGDPIICRCEGMKRSDLLKLGNGRSAFETRLVGRFGTGPCQGRFCRASVNRITGISAEELSGRNHQEQRWPLRPVSIASLCSVTPFQTEFEQEPILLQPANAVSSKR